MALYWYEKKSYNSFILHASHSLLTQIYECWQIDRDHVKTEKCFHINSSPPVMAAHPVSNQQGAVEAPVVQDSEDCLVFNVELLFCSFEADTVHQLFEQGGGQLY